MTTTVRVPELDLTITASRWEGRNGCVRLYVERNRYTPYGYFDLSAPGFPWVKPGKGDVAWMVPAIRAALEKAGLLPARDAAPEQAEPQSAPADRVGEWRYHAEGFWAPHLWVRVGPDRKAVAWTWTATREEVPGARGEFPTAKAAEADAEAHTHDNPDGRTYTVDPAPVVAPTVPAPGGVPASAEATTPASAAASQPAPRPPQDAKRITAKFPGRCAACGGAVQKGDPVLYAWKTGRTWHATCAQ